MKKVLHVLSSPIIRANGIDAFIRNTTWVMRQAGYQVDFLTDATVDYNIRGYFDNYFDTPYVHPPITGIPVIDFDSTVTERMRKVYDINKVEYDLIICSDAQATAAFLDKNTIHYVHTAGLIGENNTCLTDAYLDKEREVMAQVRVGIQCDMVAKNISGKYEFITLPMPLMDHEQYIKKSIDMSNGVLFLGEGTYRKGADIFKKKYGPNESVIIVSGCPEIDFDGYNIQSFDNTPIQITAKIKTIRNTKYCYFPSRSEVFPYSILEVALSQPVVVDDFKWTTHFDDLGIFRHIPTNIEIANYNPIKVITYLQKAEQTWKLIV